MRILIVSKALVVGQYQTKLEEIARHPDIQLTAVVPPFWRDERGTLPFERAHTRGYDLLVEPMRFNGNFHLHYYPTLPQIIARTRPDIVHIDEEPYNLATFLALRAAQHANAKTIFFTWQNIYRRYPPPFAWMEAYALRHADYAIAGNAEAQTVLRAKNYRESVCIIPQFGVDPDVFKPIAAAQRSNPSAIFRIGFAGGRLVEEKGIDLLLHASALLQNDWELRILGGGPDKERLQALARELGVESRVHFDASIPSTEMPKYLQALDVVVLPSRTRANWKEQFGRVLIEAMACGIPVIGSDCGEIPNVIGDAGIVFPENNADALRDALIELHDHHERRAELSKRGRERVLAHFTQAHIAEETVTVYHQIRKTHD